MGTATNNLDINTHDLHVKSSSDTKTFSQNDKDISGTLSVTMYGGGSGMGGSLGYGQSTKGVGAKLLTFSKQKGSGLNF